MPCLETGKIMTTCLEISLDAFNFRTISQRFICTFRATRLSRSRTTRKREVERPTVDIDTRKSIHWLTEETLSNIHRGCIYCTAITVKPSSILHLLLIRIHNHSFYRLSPFLTSSTTRKYMLDFLSYCSSQKPLMPSQKIMQKYENLTKTYTIIIYLMMV